MKNRCLASPHELWFSFKGSILCSGERKRRMKKKIITSFSSILRALLSLSTVGDVLQKVHYEYRKLEAELAAARMSSRKQGGLVASLDTLLQDAVFAVSLLTKDSTPGSLSFLLHFSVTDVDLSLCPVVILLTDGVSALEDQQNTQNQQKSVALLSRLDIPCTTIQIGSQKGFFAGCNYGFVPDNETLRYISFVTGGSFVYADELPDTSSVIIL